MSWWGAVSGAPPYLHPLIFGHDRYPGGFSLDKAEPRSEPEFHEEDSPVVLACGALRRCVKWTVLTLGDSVSCS